jgi:hypothetical protein
MRASILPQKAIPDPKAQRKLKITENFTISISYAGSWAIYLDIPTTCLTSLSAPK